MWHALFALFEIEFFPPKLTYFMILIINQSIWTVEFAKQWWNMNNSIKFYTTDKVPVEYVKNWAFVSIHEISVLFCQLDYGHPKIG